MSPAFIGLELGLPGARIYSISEMRLEARIPECFDIVIVSGVASHLTISSLAVSVDSVTST